MDSNRVTEQVAQVIRKRADLNGLSEVAFRIAFIDNGGSGSQKTFSVVWRGGGNIRKCNKDAICLTLKTNWLSICNEAFEKECTEEARSVVRTAQRKRAGYFTRALQKVRSFIKTRGKKHADYRKTT